MSRALILILVFALSGVPAAAVVCDLVLCLHPVTAAATDTGCHEHAAAQPGPHVEAVDRCAHLAAVDPGVAPASRFVAHLIVAALPAATALTESVELSRAGGPFLAHGPPTPFHATSHIPLRI